MNTRGAKAKEESPARSLISGLRFGTLVILKFLEWRRRVFPYYQVKCDCGKVVEVNGYNLTSGITRSCKVGGCRGVSDLDWFWNQIDRTSSCWNWLGWKTKKGYGELRFEGRTVRAHRLSYELKKGDIPDGLFVLHRCDNPSCVRPDHLFLGTLAENCRDRHRKGRTAFGSRNGWSKLTEPEVKSIRKLAATGHLLQKEIASQFGVTSENIGHILSGKTWRHVHVD